MKNYICYSDKGYADFITYPKSVSMTSPIMYLLIRKRIYENNTNKDAIHFLKIFS